MDEDPRLQKGIFLILMKIIVILKSEFPLANVGGQFQQKIPSLLPELIMSANAPSLSVTGPPPSFSSQRGGLSTTQPVYGGVRREHQPPSQFSG